MSRTILRATDVRVTQTGWHNLTFNYTTSAAHTVLMRVFRYTSSNGRELVFDRRVPCPVGSGTLTTGDVFYLENIPTFPNQGGNFNYQVNVEFDTTEDHGPANAPGPVNARTITITTNPILTRMNDVHMVVVPHQDDETLLFAQTMAAAVRSNRVCKVVFMINAWGTTDWSRMQEAIDVLTANNLNIPRRDIVFMGYGDWSTLEPAFNSSNHNQVFPSNRDRTFGHYTGGIFDFNFLHRRGKQAAPRLYTRNSIVGDLNDIINTYRPSEIFTTSKHEGTPNTSELHPDHRATHNFVDLVLGSLKRSLKTYSPKMNSSIVWGATSEYPGNTSNDFLNPFAQGGNQNISIKPLIWQNRVVRTLGTNSITRSQKLNALLAYVSQISPGDWLSLFAKNDEYYWVKDFANIGFISTVTCSSENVSTGQFARNAVNGVVSGFGDTRIIDGLNHQQEWVVSSGITGWIELNFGENFSVKQVNLYDRLNTTDNVLSGTLSWQAAGGGAAAIAVGALPANGARHTITFPSPVTMSRLRFDITNSAGFNTGLAEIEVIT